MSSIDAKLGAISDEKARAVLSRLHTESKREVGSTLWRYLPCYPKLFSGRRLPWGRIQFTHNKDYLASRPGAGIYCHLLARAIDVRCCIPASTVNVIRKGWVRSKYTKDVFRSIRQGLEAFVRDKPLSDDTALVVCRVT
jgi:hypothetical protein